MWALRVNFLMLKFNAYFGSKGKKMGLIQILRVINFLFYQCLHICRQNCTNECDSLYVIFIDWESSINIFFIFFWRLGEYLKLFQRVMRLIPSTLCV